MMDATTQGSVDGGEALAELLELHRAYIARTYALTRYLQEQIEHAHRLRALQWGGAARNGNGSGLNASGEWVQSYLGSAFVDADMPTVQKPGGRVTPIPPHGIRVLLFQVRWLERTGGAPPVIWYANIRAHLDDGRAAELEPYYFNVFSRLDADKRTDSQGTLKTFTAKPAKYPELHVSGRYGEAPLASLRSEQDVQGLVIQPALLLWRSTIGA